MHNKISFVTGWLESLVGITDVKPVTLKVKDEIFEGASYCGEFGRCYYFLGDIPKCRQKRKSLCFTCNGKTLFLSSYYNKDDINGYHPFGKCFMLCEWNDIKHDIDWGERYKYVRVPVTIS